jgi:hypothetical protein
VIALAACRTADGRALYPTRTVLCSGRRWRNGGSTASRSRGTTPAWNLDKRYLVDLERAGLPIVPTTWVRPGDPWAPPPGPFVVKPAISGGGRETASYHHRVDEAVAHVARLQRQGRTAMVQPYLPSVDEPGETKMVVVDGRFTHALRVGPLLDADGGVLDVPWEKPVAVAVVEPSGAEIELAHAVVAQASERCGPLLYARVDVAAAGEGRPLLMELELVDPSLSLALASQAAPRLAAVIAGRVGGHGRG